MNARIMEQPVAPDALKHQFLLLKSRDIVALKGREYETHIREYKMSSGHHQEGQAIDKEHFGRCASGFANTGGGVLIWGVDAQRDDDGVDRVVATPGVARVDQLASYLWQITPTVVAPPVVGIEHRVVRGRTGPSFVATYIPESAGGPHMCMAKGAKGRYTHKYFLRSGNNFEPMLHQQVADMFGRRVRPDLTLEVFPSPSGNSHEFIVRILNTGRGAAQAPFLELVLSRGFARKSLVGGDSFGLPAQQLHRGGGTLNAGGMDHIIHPTMFLDVCRIGLSGGDFPSAVKTAGPRCEIKFTLGSLGVPPQRGSISIDLPSI